MVNICVLEKNKETIGFLKGFFKGRREYSVGFYSSGKELNWALKKGCDLLIVGAPQCLKGIRNTKCPVIAMVSDVTKGLKCVVEQNIESYLTAPFHYDDFEYKLKTALGKRGLLQDLYREKQDLEAVAELTYLVSSTLNPKEVLYFVVKKLSEVIKVTRCSILSVGFGEKRYATVVSTFEDSRLEGIRLDLKKYPEIKKALASKSTVVVKDAMSDPLMRPVRRLIRPLGIRSIVVIPVIFRDEVIGTLFLKTSRAGHVFFDREIKLCNAIAKASANALYNAFLFERTMAEKTKLERLAITDFLTGVYNIRYFYHRIEEEFGRARRYKAPVSAVMFDIDFFKQINDLHGHRVGDAVLREFAQLVKRHTRKSDVFARYGGEEFILLLPHTPIDGAVAEGKRLSKIIKVCAFKGIGKKRLTVSMGVASSSHPKVKTQDDLITFADNALFEAKKTGRDKLVVFK